MTSVFHSTAAHSVTHLQRLIHACRLLYHLIARVMGSSPSLLCNHLCSSSGGPAVDQAVWLSISHVCQNTSLYCYCYLLLPCIVGGISAAMTMTKTNSAACVIIIVIVLLVTTTTD